MWYNIIVKRARDTFPKIYKSSRKGITKMENKYLDIYNAVVDYIGWFKSYRWSNVAEDREDEQEINNALFPALDLADILDENEDLFTDVEPKKVIKWYDEFLKAFVWYGQELPRIDSIEHGYIDALDIDKMLNSLTSADVEYIEEQLKAFRKQNIVEGL